MSWERTQLASQRESGMGAPDRNSKNELDGYLAKKFLWGLLWVGRSVTLRDQARAGGCQVG